MASLAHPPRFSQLQRRPGGLTLTADDGAVVHIQVLEPDIIRVAVLPAGSFVLPATWAIAAGGEDVPEAGRDRLDPAGFSCPAFDLVETDETLVLATGRLRLTVRRLGFACAWEMMTPASWTPIARDRPTQAYNFGWWDEAVHHYLEAAPGEKYFGLGERSGEMDRAGRRLRLRNMDAMGYSARTSDPLYKHVPFYITLQPQTGAAFGLFYDTLSDCAFDFGCERDNYHGLYRSFTAPHGDLDYYVIAGPQVAGVTRRFTWLTGRPAFTPRWSLGYSGSTMSYTDAPDAQAEMARFLEGCETHDILCDSFHLSSGYTSIGDKRYVFNWNRDKFPDPVGFVKSYAERGVHLVANVKPCLLRDHPRFEEARRAGFLICDGAGEPAWVQFWDEIGAYLDFTAPGAADWWRANITEALLDYGVGGIWNDNNEYEIWSATAPVAGFGKPWPARETKPLQTLLMMRASRLAEIAHDPQMRPYQVSRSGAAGMQRYVQTWSGDNSTSWETLAYNIPMGLGLSLSGISNFGHDIGGFAGPAPDPDLLVRWVESGLLLPRFSIHSWNDDGTVNEPWMHPEATATIAELIRWRYRLTPYLYHRLWHHHDGFEPILRPTFHDFPDDPACLAPGFDFLVGPDLLAAPVIEPGAETREVWLPAGAAWRDFWDGTRFEGGQTVRLSAPWGRPPLLAREGACVPLNIADQRFGVPADQRAFAVFAPSQGLAEGSCFEDDGVSITGDGRDSTLTRLRVDADAANLTVRLEGAAELILLLPSDDTRTVRFEQGEVQLMAPWKQFRRLSLSLA